VSTRLLLGGRVSIVRFKPNAPVTSQFIHAVGPVSKDKSLPGRLFARGEPSQLEWFQAMVEMAGESQRTYGAMIEIYNSDVALGVLAARTGSAVSPSPRGVYKARLFGASFLAFAHARSSASQAEKEEMVNVATGVALAPPGSEGSLVLDRTEAQSFSIYYLTSLLKAIQAAFKAGQLLPGMARPEHTALADYLHDALSESIGPQNYTPAVHERFDIMVLGNTALAMSHARRWIV
jgi:hypothetical protein